MYAAFFTFNRKLGGALGVWVAGVTLDLAGFAPGQAQSESSLWAIRLLTSVAPAAFLVAAAFFARGYTLDRAEHARIRQALDDRDSPIGDGQNVLK